MAAAELAVEPPHASKRSSPLRLFFLGMALFSAAILMLAFVPEFAEFAAGKFPIAWVLHIHAGIMFSWWGAFAVQAYLGASGKTKIHRRVGVFAIAIGWLAWASAVAGIVWTGIAAC